MNNVKATSTTFCQGDESCSSTAHTREPLVYFSGSRTITNGPTSQRATVRFAVILWRGSHTQSHTLRARSTRCVPGEKG